MTLPARDAASSRSSFTRARQWRSVSATSAWRCSMRIDARRLVIIAVLGAAIVAWQTPWPPARRAHRKALADFIGPSFAAKLNDCRTCHQPQSPEDAAEALELGAKPHNAFGKRLKALRRENRGAGRPS